MVRGASRRSGASFGSSPSASRKSRGERLRDRYSTDRYPTAEDFIRAVEENPEHFDPGSMDQGKFRYDDSGNGRGVGASNLKGSNKSNWIEDNPIDVDIDTDPGSISVSSELWNNEEGDSVSVVAGVDLIPMGIDINVNGDVGTVAVDLGMPGDAIGVTVGVSFDTETGEIIGGQGGLAGGGLSVNVNQIRKDGETCTTITVTYMGIGTAYQQCRKDDDDEKDPEKDPPPPPGSEIIPPPPEPMPPPQIPGDQNRSCIVAYWYNADFYDRVMYLPTPRVEGCTGIFYFSQDKRRFNLSWNYPRITMTGTVTEKTTGGYYPKDLSWTINGTRAIMGSYGQDGVRWDPNDPEIENNGTMGTAINYLRGSVSACNNYLKGTSSYFSAYRENWLGGACNHGGSVYISSWAVIAVYFPDTGETWNPPPEEPEKPKEPEPPIPPEDPVTCCDLEPVMSMLRKLNQALAVDEVIGPGLELPNEWILPTGKGRSKMKNYLEIAVFLAKMQDHLGVHPLTVQIADLNAGQEGNQEFKKFYPNGTKAIQEILTILHDENSDSADRLNLQMRLAVLNTRIFLTVASISRSLRGVFQFLGVPIREKREAVPLPFDFAFGLRKNKGFSNDAKKDGEELERNMKKLQEELNKNTENATEALLAKFLADSDQPIGYETFDPNLPDLLDRLKQLLDKK